MHLLLLLIAPLACAAIIALLSAQARTRAAVLAGLTTVGGLLVLARDFPAVRQGESLVERIAWVPALELDLVLRLDGLSWMFSMLVLGIGALIMLYARYYLSPGDPVP